MSTTFIPVGDVTTDLVSDVNLNVDEFANWYSDGVNHLKTKRLMENELRKVVHHPVMRNYNYDDIDDIWDVDNTKKLNVLKRMNINDLDKIQDFKQYNTYKNVLGNLTTVGRNSLLVQPTVFIKVLKELGTPDLYERFGRRAENSEIIGAFVQTEIGTGKFLRGLRNKFDWDINNRVLLSIQTRADYDRATQEFVINTPSTLAYKLWPGVGVVPNHAVLVAQMYIDNVNRGAQLFVVPVRDLATKQLLRGIDIGIIDQNIDLLDDDNLYRNLRGNAYLGLRDVRIPRTNMLMKYTKVTVDGNVIDNVVNNVNTLPLLNTRYLNTMANTLNLMENATFATRFTTDFSGKSMLRNDRDSELINQVAVQVRVFPEIAKCIALNLTNDRIARITEDMLKSNKLMNKMRMVELQALTCVVKAMTLDTNVTNDVLRHRTFNGLDKMVLDTDLGFDKWMVDRDIDDEVEINYIQVGKILLDVWDNVIKCDNVLTPKSMSYLKKAVNTLESPIYDGSWTSLIKIMEFVGMQKISIAHKKFTTLLQNGHRELEALVNCRKELKRAAKMYGHIFITKTLLNEVTGYTVNQRSVQLNRTLEKILELYLMNAVLRGIDKIVKHVDLTDRDVMDFQKRFEIVLRKLRPDIIAICDGFAFNNTKFTNIVNCDDDVFESVMHKLIRLNNGKLYKRSIIRSQL